MSGLSHNERSASIARNGSVRRSPVSTLMLRAPEASADGINRGPRAPGSSANRLAPSPLPGLLETDHSLYRGEDPFDVFVMDLSGNLASRPNHRMWWRLESRTQSDNGEFAPLGIQLQFETLRWATIGCQGAMSSEFASD